MKKIITGAALILLTMTTQAQTAKSTWLMGGNLGFQSLNSQGTQLTLVNLNPTAGYFIMDNLAVGLGLNYNYLKMEQVPSISSISGGPFVRYYFLPIGDKAKLFANGHFDYGTSETSNDGNQSADFYDWGITAGPAIFLNKSIALEVSLGYNYNKYKAEDGSTDGFVSNVGFQVHFGK